jgi:hypothetical protein
MSMSMNTGEINPQSLKDEIIDYNAEGVKYLVKGSFRSATTSFLSALECSKRLFDQDFDSTMLDSTEGNKSFHTVEIDYRPHEMDPDSAFTTYSHGLVIPDRGTFESILARNEDLIPCILLFNIGLSLQIQTRSSNETALLRRAHHAYDIALTLLKGMSAYPPEADTLFLLLAVMNNLAAIESRRYNRNKAIKYGELIRGVLENEDFAHMLGDSVFDFFILYLFISPLACQSGAPAA